MTNEKYDIPQELVDLQMEANAAEVLGKYYVKMPFGYKKALRAFTNQAKLNDDFWRNIYALYPDIKGKPLQCNTLEKCVFVVG